MQVGYMKISLVVLGIAVGASFFYRPFKFWYHTDTESKPEEKKEVFIPKIFTKDELWKWYRGEDGSKGLCIAFLGKVYDVRKGKDHYGPGGGYHFFAGRDGTRGFITGDFSDDGLVDHVDGLDPSSYLGFEDWMQFYEKTYRYVGTLVGNFYDAEGEPTEALKSVEKAILLAKELKAKDEDLKKKFPPCNSMSSPTQGRKVWCTQKSGGIDRNWVGVPRLFHPPGAREARCVCVRTTGAPSSGEAEAHGDRGDLNNPYLQLYPTCSESSDTCILEPPGK